MSFLKTIALSGLLVGTAAAASAAVVLDTLNDTGMPFDYYANPTGMSLFNIGYYEPIGQSFTLDAATSALTVSAYISSFSGFADVDVSLKSGAGVGGALLATGSFAVDPITRDEAELALFDFSALGLLAAGTYTIVFEGTGALGGGNQGVDTAGTDSWDEDGLFDFGSNRAKEFGILVEGDVAPVPLPASLPLLLAGMGVLALRRRSA